MVMSSTTTSTATAPLQQPPRGGDSNASTIARSDAKTPDPSTKANTDPPQGSSSQKVAVKPGNEVGPGPQQATGIRVAGSTELQGAAEIWTGRNAKGLYAYLVTRTISVPLGRITEHALTLAKQGSTPLNRSENFYGLAKSLMADPGISGRDYTAGNVEIVADQPVTQAELTANYGMGSVPTFNRRVHDVMSNAGLAPDPRDGRTYTLPATRLGGQTAAGIFFNQPQGQAGVLDGMADAKRLFPGAPKAFIDGFNESKGGFYAMRALTGIETGVSLLAVRGGLRVWNAKAQNLPARLNNTLYVPGAGPVARMTSALMNRLSPAPRAAGAPNKPVTPAVPTKTQTPGTTPARPAPALNGSQAKPSGGGRSNGGSPGLNAAQRPYDERTPIGVPSFAKTPSSGNAVGPNGNAAPGLLPGSTKIPTPPQPDVKRSEADVFFGRFTSQTLTKEVQSNALTINGKRGVALNASQWGEATRLYRQANTPQRGTVSLAMLREHTLQGPHGQTRKVPVLETWADLTPEEAGKLLNRAAGFNAKGERQYTPTLINPPGAAGKDAITQTLKANGLSPEGLAQRAKVLHQRQHPNISAAKAQPLQTAPKKPPSTSGTSVKAPDDKLSEVLKRPPFVVSDPQRPTPDPYDRLSQEGVRVTFTPYDRDLLKTSTSNAAVYRTGETQPPEGTSGQPTTPIDYSRFGRTAVIGDFPDGSVSKGTAALLASKLNGATPLVVVGDKYTPNIIGDMAAQGNNRTVFAKTLERYQDVRTVFYARPTNFANPDSVRDFVRFAYQLPAGANAMVATNEGQSFATFGHKLRPDVNWSGNSSYGSFLGGRSADSTAQLAVSAVTDSSALANGTARSNLARPLKADDARFVSEALGLSVQDGLVISAPFDGHGNLERPNFMQQYSRDPGAARASLLHAISDWNDGQSRVLAFATGNRPELAGTTFPQLMDNSTQLANLIGVEPPSVRVNQARPVTPSQSPDYSILGKTAVLGASSKAGGAALAQLAGEVPLVGVSRSNVQAEMPRGVTWSNRVPSDVKTVIVTAAVDWRRDDKNQIIFDRKALVQDNINVVLPYLDSIPRGATVNVVTNPSNTIAWVVQALRPDLKVLGHEGTDVGRLDARNRDGLLFGLHSPFLVATDRNGNPDSVVPVAGNIYARGGHSATSTTGTSAVTEAKLAREGIPGNYAMALSPGDAAWLTQLARTHITGWDREIPAGMVVTAPINPANGTLLRPQIESLFRKFAADERAGVLYTALRPIPKSPNFNRVQLRPTQLLSQALQELFDERGYALEALRNIVSEKHPELRQVPIEQLLTDPANLLRLLQ
jgi:hypothetical protein